MKKIAILTNVNPTKSYSGIKYLAEALTQKGVSVDIYGKIPKDQINETNSWNANVYSFYDTWFGRIPYIRRFFIAIFVCYIMVKYHNIVVHELYFYRQFILVKKFFSNKIFIHYATELYTEDDEPGHKAILNFYRKHSNKADAIIECDELRLIERAKLFGQLPNVKYVIPNTLPTSEFSCANENAEIIKTIANANSSGYKTIVYTGAAYLHRELDRFIDAMKLSNVKLFFIGIVYGSKADIEALQRYTEERLDSNSFKIFKNQPRATILGSIGSANAGFVYYRPSLTIGNRLASPTKFYEYIGLGIPVICSNNETLLPLVEKFKLGVCVQDETIDALTSAIELIFDENKGIYIHSRKYSSNSFKENLCYEVSSKSAISNLFRLLKG